MISYAGLRPFGHAVSFGTLVAFIAYLEQFFGPIRDLSSRYTQLQSALTGAERVFLLLDNQDEDAPHIPPVDGASLTHPPLSEAPVALEFDHVTFAYKADAPILHDLSFRVRPGERVALVGPTGSGKSTIAGLLLRLYDVGAPGIRVFGREVTSYPRTELRQLFSVVPQDVFLFPGTIADNIAVGDATANLASVERALDTLGILDWFQAREHGLLAPVDERGSNFSAGERQLIAFARAVYRNAPVLILDEATANVDSNTEGRLQVALERLLTGRTALIIAHRLSTIRAVDRILVLQQGNLLESGTHEELMARAGLYARLYALQGEPHAPELLPGGDGDEKRLP